MYSSESPGVFSPSHVLPDTSTTNQIAAVNSISSPLATRGVRARLGFSRPYSSFFKANVTIHQLSNVPYRAGEFGVRWRFKDVQVPREGQLLSSNLTSPHSSARGITPYEKVENFTVVWSYSLNVLLKIGVDRETAQMSPSALKLVVLQRVNGTDSRNAPQTSRFGVVYLDLTQFVGHGCVQRRYLLRESKTNSTIEISLEMELVSGTTRYIPPPLGLPETKSVMLLFQEDSPSRIHYARAQRELQEYVVNQLKEVLAEHSSESAEIDMLSQEKVPTFDGMDDQSLENPHLTYTPPPVEESMLPHKDIEGLEGSNDELSEEAFFDPDEQLGPDPVTVEHVTSFQRSRTSSNSSYASARSIISVSESLHEPYYEDDISLYSIASSRTAETDYGLYYRRMALSQSTIDSGRTAELRRSRSWNPSTVTITGRRNSGSTIGAPSLRL